MMSFDDIEQRRADAGIEQKALCLRAGVNPNTYSAWKARRQWPNSRSLDKVLQALNDLIAEREAAA